jgi:hypothetical protein
MKVLRDRYLAERLAFAVLIACGMGPEAIAVPACNNIIASQSPTENYNCSCLASTNGIARLTAGIFPLSRKIIVPRGSKLIGRGGDHEASTIAAAPFSTQSWGNALLQRYPNNNVLEISDENTVQDLSLTGDGQLHADCCTTVVAIVGSRYLLNNVDIFDLEPQARRLPQNPSGGKPAGCFSPQRY